MKWLVILLLLAGGATLWAIADKPSCLYESARCYR